MKTPHVIFDYNTDKDIDNIKIGLETIRNGRKPDNQMKLIIDDYGRDPSDEDLKKYVSQTWENKENIQRLIVDQLQEYWNSIETRFFEHLCNRMQLTSYFNIEKLYGYLSIRFGSGYDHENSWFAVSIHYGEKSVHKYSYPTYKCQNRDFFCQYPKTAK